MTIRRLGAHARRKMPVRRVQYAVADAFVYAANCHCRAAARDGSALKPVAGIEREQLT